MRKYARAIAKPIPQSEPIDERQVENNAGGFVYTLDIWKRLDRFLILGSDSATYYQKAADLTRENARVVTDCYNTDADRTVDVITNTSLDGRAPKNDPAIFALAIGAAHQNVKVRQAALRQLPHVCRTSTHLFQFVTATRALGKGWGRALKEAVAFWYSSKSVDQVAFQAIKYRQREGYTHKRLLDMAHAPSSADPSRKALYHWIKGKAVETVALPSIVRGHVDAMQPDLKEKGLLKLISDHRLPWEALPTEANANPKVWREMLPTLGYTALIRNLGNMTRIGAITPLSDTEALVVKRLGDSHEMAKARVHPFALLLAQAVYGHGQGVRGSGTWTPSQPIMAALDDAFYAAFANVAPTRKRFFIGLDVSGSMSSPFMGSPLMCSQATAALSLVTMATEPRTYVLGFAQGMRELGLTPKMRLSDAVNRVSNLTTGGTDCAMPMVYAGLKNVDVDVFVVMTDNETWAGHIHPSHALQAYRRKTGINAKLIVVGMTSTGFSIADPNDGGMLDIVGFDANCPALISEFARG